jgi:hypothetical protein
MLAMFYNWNKEFLEAGKKRLAGYTLLKSLLDTMLMADFSYRAFSRNPKDNQSLQKDQH